MLALVDGVPHVLNLREVLQYYIAHQEEVIRRRTEFDLRKAKERAHLLEGFVLALDNIDEIIAIIKASSDDKTAKAALIKRFGFSEVQADAILEMRLRRLTALERSKIEEELAALRERIAYYEKLLADATMVSGVIKDELGEIRAKFADKRRTEICGAARDLDVEDLIAEEDMVVTITKAGYVKRLPVATYRQQKRGGKGVAGVNLKDNDFVENLFIASTHDYVLFFSTKGKVYRLKVHELPVGSRHARGTAVVNLLPFEQNERIAAVINTKDFPEDEFLLFATARGMIKKTNLKAYGRVHAGGIIAINLVESDELISVRRVREGQKVIMVSTAGKAVHFEESQTRPMGRDTRGVKGMTLKEDECVLGMEIAPTESQLFVVTERGYGKRSRLGDYPLHKRGGQGVKTIVMTSKKGLLAGMKIVSDDHELMLVSEEGVVIRVRARDVSLLGRSTQGVKVMNVGENDRVSAIARVSGANKKKTSKATKVADGQMSLPADEDAEYDAEADAGIDAADPIIDEGEGDTE
jgi:DNA gyrase subunit A